MLTDVFVESTDTPQYLHATSCHVYHSKKSIQCSQALRFNRICSMNQFLDRKCNDLKNRAFNDNLLKKKILKARNIGEQIFV